MISASCTDITTVCGGLKGNASFAGETDLILDLGFFGNDIGIYRTSVVYQGGRGEVDVLSTSLGKFSLPSSYLLEEKPFASSRLPHDTRWQGAAAGQAAISQALGAA